MQYMIGREEGKGILYLIGIEEEKGIPRVRRESW